MKLLNMAILFALTVALGSTLAAQRTAAPSPVLRSPEIVLKEFYKWYIHELNQDLQQHGEWSNYPWKTTNGRAILKKYLTLRAIRAIDRNEKLPAEDPDAFDADYFLLDQDFSGYSEKNIFVSKVAIKGTTATAIVRFYRGDDRGVTVSLRQEGGVWKIDKVGTEEGAAW